MTDEIDPELERRIQKLFPPKPVVVERKVRRRPSDTSLARFEFRWLHTEGDRNRHWEVVCINGSSRTIYAEGGSPLELTKVLQRLRSSKWRVDEMPASYEGDVE